jgi:putative transposase
MSLRIEHRQNKSLNNRAQNSHRPTTWRERIMKRSKSAQDAQRFLSTLDQVANLFHVPHPKKAPPEERRAMRHRAFAVWHDILKTTAA